MTIYSHAPNNIPIAPALINLEDTHATPNIFIFDLDGTLTDSVYQNVAAWKEALDSENIPLAMTHTHTHTAYSSEDWYERSADVKNLVP